MWTQFFGALNDNLFKNALVVLLTFKSVKLWGFETHMIVALSGGIFILPFFFFSAISGQLADKFEKSKLARYVKWLELLIMLIAAVGFYFHYFNLLMICLFLMGLHSTFFGPIKYSIIPELLNEKELVAGNAMVEMGTFLAILIGTIASGIIMSTENGEWYITFAIILVAVVGLLFSIKIPKVSIADPHLNISYNPFPQTWQNIKLATPNKAVFNSILAISWFWFFGAALLSILPVMTKNLLFANAQVVTIFLAVFTIGIALGAFICEKLSFDRVEIGLVPLGSLGMTIFLADLGWALTSCAPLVTAEQLLSVSEFLSQPGSHRILIDLLLVSVSGGVFTVPLYTLLQERSERKIRSRIIASNNILNAMFMVISSLLLMFLYSVPFTIPQIIFIFALLNLIVAFYIYSVVPEFTLRFISWIISRLMYRIRVTGSENIPREGAAVLICNHVSFVDWLIISSAVKRPVRFVMYCKIFSIPIVKYFFRNAKVIPIAGAQENKKIFDRAFDSVSQELKAGELVCIFPEGFITRDGELQKFKRGIEHIIQRDPVPVIPMALIGLWGSLFSRKDGPALRKIPRRFWFHIDVRIGQAVPAAHANAENLQLKVASLLKD